MELHFHTSTALESAAVNALAGKLTPYLSRLRRVVEMGGYGAPECSLSVPADTYMLHATEAIVERVYSAALRYIFVVGIGGSNLGTKAIYDALAGMRDLYPHTHTRLIFIDTTDPVLLSVAQSLITSVQSADELLFLVITKSGTTTETLFNAESLLSTFATKFGRNAKRVVVLSESGSPLLRAATDQQMYTIPLPPQVGGRYSVLSPVGLLPLALLGFDIRSMQSTALAMIERCLHPEVTINPAAQSALTQYYWYTKGVRQQDTFVFTPALESVGKWYRQLLAESLGKTIEHNNVKVGITPTVTVGSTDLHSVGQLYLGGPRDRLTTFVSVQSWAQDVRIKGNERAWPDVVPMIDSKNATDIMAAIYAGTVAAYNTNQLPYLEVVLPKLDVTSIVAFMQFKMCEVMMLGYLLEVNPFDQPHVEQYKTVTKSVLEK